MGLFDWFSSRKRPVQKTVLSASNIAAKLQEFGLSRVATQLETLVRPAIGLKAAPALAGPIGTTRLGGLPDLPDELEWPTWKGVPLGFIAQINLEEASPFDVENCLPHAGMLYFFYETANQTWGFDPQDRGSSRVLFCDVPVSALQRRKAPDDLPPESHFTPQTVLLEPELTLPGWETLPIENLKLKEVERDAYIDLLENIEPKLPLHWLLGHPHQVQGEMQVECQLVTNGIYCGNSSGYEDPRVAILKMTATDWQLLLQIDSDDSAGMIWGDVGHIFFWIRKQDLAERDFSNCWLILQCY